MEPVENVEHNWNAFFINNEKKKEEKTIGTVRIANTEEKKNTQIQPSHHDNEKRKWHIN